MSTANPSVLSSSTITGDAVVNREGESLGKVEDLMIDLSQNRVAYAVLSFGGFLGMGNKLFAVPFESLEVDGINERLILDVPKEKLENAPGFDKDNWPNFADETWVGSIRNHYGRAPYRVDGV